MAKKETQPRYLPTEDVAVMYGLRPTFLRKLRSQQAGPPYRKQGDGRIVIYPLDAFDAWFNRAFPQVQPRADLV